MRLVEQLKRHEVLRRWALGEVNSKFFNPLLESDRELMIIHLLSGVYELECDGIQRVLKFKQGLVDSISIYINWYRALLEINKSDLDLVYTLQLPGWERNTNGTYLISDAARNIHKTSTLDRRVRSIYESIKRNNVTMQGITLLAVDKIGPYVVVEGTGRLTGVYMAQQLDRQKILENNQLEVTLGLY